MGQEACLKMDNIWPSLSRSSRWNHLCCGTAVEQPTVLENCLPYETVPCTNHFKIKGEYSEHHKRKENGYNIFCTSDDNEVSVSWEDRRFMDIMECGIHKNDSGNWEMALPFRSHDISMPNNRSQAVSRLNGSLRSFKREPQMEK